MRSEQSGLTRVVKVVRIGSMSLTVTAADAKAGLSELLRRAEAGEEIIVTRNGEPVATSRSHRRLFAWRGGGTRS
jgi:Antitoxin Phd_YefM, type II toxin-antitoxin system